MDGNYFVLVNANETGEQWDTGWYNLTFTPIAAPLPDLVAEPATCPITAETTGYTAPFMAQVSSVGGPMDATTFAWELALVDEEMPVVAVAPNDELLEKLQSNLHEVRARGSHLYVFAAQNAVFTEDDGITIVRLPEVSSLMAPIVYVVPLQMLAYHVAVGKGTDVDQPRNLAKSVTVE